MHVLHSSCSKSSLPHLAFASACLMVLRWLVAGRALDFDEELCSICICVYMYLYKRYVGEPDICIFYIAPVQNPVPSHLAFASARLMALRRLVAGRALDFEPELCSIKAL